MKDKTIMAKNRFYQLLREYQRKELELQKLRTKLIQARSDAGLDDVNINQLNTAEIPERIYGRNFNILD